MDFPKIESPDTVEWLLIAATHENRKRLKELGLELPAYAGITYYGVRRSQYGTEGLALHVYTGSAEDIRGALYDATEQFETHYKPKTLVDLVYKELQQ